MSEQQEKRRKMLRHSKKSNKAKTLKLKQTDMKILKSREDFKIQY